MDNTYKILYSNINEFDDLIIDEKESELNDDILTTVYHHYAYDGQLMGIIKLSDKMKRKIRKVIYVSLETTKILLKYLVKSVVDIVSPCVVKELINIGVDVIIELINDYLDKEKFEVFNKQKEELFSKLSNETVKVIKRLFKSSDKIMEKQDNKLKKEIKRIKKHYDNDNIKDN